MFVVTSKFFLNKKPIKSTFFMQTSVSTRGLEHALPHTRTKESTSTQLAARKVRGGRDRGMLVLAHTDKTKWQRMIHQQMQQAVQCPCGYEIQNVEHVLPGECEYMEESLHHNYVPYNH